MMRAFPFSLIFFAATAVVFVLQAIPVVGIFLMFMLAMFWSVLLINAGMIGTAIEALTGRVSRWWLVLPVAFYGGYYAFASADHATLRNLNGIYAAANGKVAIPFSPDRHALVFTGDGNGGSWYTQNYVLPVAFSRNKNYPEGHRSNRMMPNEVCGMVRRNPALSAAQIWTFGFHDGDAIGSRKMEKQFCDLGMPERPVLPAVTVARKEERVHEGTLPVTRVTTIVTMPDGKIFTLLGGVAAPLSWLPMPVIGCGLNSGAPSWDCSAAFWRNGFTPIVPGNTRYSRDSVVLAEALGLKRIAIFDRRGGDETLVRVKIAEVEKATLTRQLAAIDRMVADPLGKAEWQVGVVANTGEALLSRAEPIMSGVERAAAYRARNEIGKARESGRVLAGLVADLPRDRFVAFGPRILALYRANVDPIPDPDGRSSSRADSHWLWESEALLRRIGDLGPDALFVATDSRASGPNVNGAGIEAMCRIGAAGRATAQVLLSMWNKTDRFDRDERRALFVALRRIGIDPPPLVESEEERQRRERAKDVFGGIAYQKLSPMETLLKDWGDVTPASPPRVCSPNEWQARREEERGGTRRTNLL